MISLALEAVEQSGRIANPGWGIIPSTKKLILPETYSLINGRKVGGIPDYILHHESRGEPPPGCRWMTLQDWLSIEILKIRILREAEYNQKYIKRFKNGRYEYLPLLAGSGPFGQIIYQPPARLRQFRSGKYVPPSGTPPGYLGNGDIDLESPPTDLTPSSAVSYANTSGIVIEFKIFENSSGAAITLNNCSDVLIENNIIRDPNKEGVNAHTSSTGVTIRNNWIKGTGKDGTQSRGRGVRVFDTLDDIVIAGNRFEDCCGDVHFEDDAHPTTEKDNIMVWKNHSRNVNQKGANRLTDRRASVLLWDQRTTNGVCSDNASLHEPPSVTGTDIAFISATQVSSVGTDFSDLCSGQLCTITTTDPLHTNDGVYTLTSKTYSGHNSYLLTFSGAGFDVQAADDAGTVTLASDAIREDHYNIGHTTRGTTGSHFIIDNLRAKGGNSGSMGALVLGDSDANQLGGYWDVTNLVAIRTGGNGLTIHGGHDCTYTGPMYILSDEENIYGGIGLGIYRFGTAAGFMYNHAFASASDIHVYWLKVAQHTDVYVTAPDLIKRDANAKLSSTFGVGKDITIVSTLDGTNDGTYTVEARTNNYTITTVETSLTTKTSAEMGTTLITTDQHSYYPVPHYLDGLVNHGQASEVTPTNYGSIDFAATDDPDTVWDSSDDAWNATDFYVASGDL